MAKILLIDDMDYVRQALKTILERGGHSVVAAADAEQGLNSVRAEKFDLVITDVVMPGMDGVEVIVQLKSAFPNMPILAISGGTAEVSSAQTLLLAKQKANMTLSKPFENEELLNAVKKLVG